LEGLCRATLLPDCIILLKGAIRLIAPGAFNSRMATNGVGFYRVSESVAKIV
jgi:hypothetical protein